MDFRDIVALALEEVRRDLYKALDGLTREELTWQPGPESNPIGFLAWHLARDEDGWIQGFCRQQPQIWVRDGWYKKLGLPERGSGYGYTPEQVRSFPLPDIKLVQAYYDAVRVETLAYLKGMSPGDLWRCPREDRPGYSIANALAHLLVEESLHMGQVGYIRGLKRGHNK